MKTIRITGRGQIRVTPDKTRIMIALNDVCEEYAQALEKASKERATLQEVLRGFGFADSDLKTLNFNIDPEYEGYQEDGIWKQKFKGYRYYHQLKLEFPSDNDKLGKVLYAMAASGLTPEFSIGFFASDPEAVRNELLADAVADAKAKAEALTAAAGVSLGKIQSIDYAKADLNLAVNTMRMPMMAKGMAAEECCDSYDMDVQPDDIELTDTVTILWEIV
ncbi:MAG: SIMPL domain-containing protein [Firmicutes bacterium]|nr:SIMPL domain-containing protein [Bacillota bacterium]